MPPTQAGTFKSLEGMRLVAPRNYKYVGCEECGNLRMVDEDARPLCMHCGNQVAFAEHDGADDWTRMRPVEVILR